MEFCSAMSASVRTLVPERVFASLPQNIVDRSRQSYTFWGSIALRSGGGKALIWSDFIPEDLRELYEVHDYHHAAAILKNEFPKEFNEPCAALRGFRVTTAEIKKSGGNRSDMPKKFSALLGPSWTEKKLKASMVVDGKTVGADTHKIDHAKDRVALDVEWNSKDRRSIATYTRFARFLSMTESVLGSWSRDQRMT